MTSRKRMTIAQAEAAGLLEHQPKKSRKGKIPQPSSPGEETLAMHLKAHKIAFKREFEFHDVRHWKVDFAFLSVKLAVEIEGGVGLMGRHQRPEGFIEDMYKYNALVMKGWRLLRFSTRMVMKGEAIATILEALGVSSA